MNPYAWLNLKPDPNLNLNLNLNPYAWLAWPPTAWHAAQAAHERNPGTLCQRPSGAAPGQLVQCGQCWQCGMILIKMALLNMNHEHR